MMDNSITVMHLPVKKVDGSPILPCPAMKNNKKCLVEVCEKNAKTRGLCKNCYAIAHIKVRRNHVTWEQLELLGMSLKLQENRGPSSAPFTLEFEAKKREALGYPHQ